MSRDLYGFVFYEQNPAFSEEQDFIARIPLHLVGTDALFEAISHALNFPSYFGFNWNALSDCLQDLSWIDTYRVVIVHEDLPTLPTRELSVYLDILQESVSSWKQCEHHELVVAFRQDVKDAIQKIMSAPT